MIQMQKRLRNAMTLEIRDVHVGSQEDMELSAEVYSVGGISKPKWILDSEWRKEEDARDAEVVVSDEVIMFSNSGRTLTPGEAESGFLSYEHKEAELLAERQDSEPDEEIEPEDPVAADDEEDDEEEEEDDDLTPPPTRTRVRTTKQSVPRRRGTRASGARKAA